MTVRPNAHPTVPAGVRVYYRHLASTLPFAEALAVADAAVRLNLCDPTRLTSAAAMWTGRRPQAVRRVAERVDGRSVNPFESALRALTLEARCDGFEPQVRIQAGRSMRVDLAHRRLRIVLEADSFEWHGGRAALRRDWGVIADVVARGNRVEA